MGEEARDRVAHDLTETDFDAVERDGYRAEWHDGDTEVAVRDLETDDVVAYNAEDLFRATSEQELRNARTGAEALE